MLYSGDSFFKATLSFYFLKKREKVEQKLACFIQKLFAYWQKNFKASIATKVFFTQSFTQILQIRIYLLPTSMFLNIYFYNPTTRQHSLSLFNSLCLSLSPLALLPLVLPWPSSSQFYLHNFLFHFSVNNVKEPPHLITEKQEHYPKLFKGKISFFS